MPSTAKSAAGALRPEPSKNANLVVRSLSLDRLKPDPRNARRHSAKQIRQIATSIERFGFNVPVLIDAEFNVLAGHGRILACKRLGWTEVPTICIAHLSQAQKQAFLIADNRLAEVAVWDDQLLGEQLKALASVELDFDLEAIGFDMGEIDFRIESLDGDDDKAAEPPIPDVMGPAVSRIGDLWRLGRHMILCGDARDAKAHSRLMVTERAAAVITDPPFNVAIDGHVSGLGQVHHREFVMGSGEMTPEAFTQFLEDALARMVVSSEPGAVGYIFMDWRHLWELLAAARANKLELLNLCIWAKANAGMGSLYRSQHELVVVVRLGAGRHRNNVQLGKHGRHRSNVWNYANGPGFGRASEEGKLAALHPTIKPIVMLADAILDVTRRGDIVLDPFLGSGSTLMACERVGRRCRGLELDPLYCDVIVRRWQAQTGARARHEASGLSFDEMRAQRAEEAVEANSVSAHAAWLLPSDLEGVTSSMGGVDGH